MIELLFLTKINYIISISFIVLGLYMVAALSNLFKKLLGISIMQGGTLFFFISYSKIVGAKPPLLDCLQYQECPRIYTNPIPHVLMLTAIVVGFTTLAIALALLLKIKHSYNSIDENLNNVSINDSNHEHLQ